MLIYNDIYYAVKFGENTIIKSDNAIVRFKRRIMYISELNIYPIKSLKGISLSESLIEQKGLRFDRRRLLVDGKNEFLTQREFPKMATLAVEVIENGLRISDGDKFLEIPFEPPEKVQATVKIWSSRVRALVYENEINRWFGEVLQTDCKLVLMPEESIRKVNYFYAVHKDDAVSFADGYPFLLIGENSLNDLNARLETGVPMNRFRPNFVVAGSEPFDEDDWKKIKIGDAVFHVVKPCGRCVITTIDQERGSFAGKEPLKTLATYRIPNRSVKRKINFGQNLIAETVGVKIKVGDKVEVLERKKSAR